MSNSSHNNSLIEPTCFSFKKNKKVVYSSLKNRKIFNSQRNTGFNSHRSTKSGDLHHILNRVTNTD